MRNITDLGKLYRTRQAFRLASCLSFVYLLSLFCEYVGFLTSHCKTDLTGRWVSAFPSPGVFFSFHKKCGSLFTSESKIHRNNSPLREKELLDETFAYSKLRSSAITSLVSFGPVRGISWDGWSGKTGRSGLYARVERIFFWTFSLFFSI